jgi:hypothetical protein
MTITFRIDDGLDTLLPTPAVITTDQLGSLRDLLAEQGERLSFCLLIPEHGEVSEAAFAFEARVCPLALAMVSRCFDHNPSVIAVLDEAQFLGRRVRVWRMDWSGDIRIGLASGLDDVPELEVANGNASALLETLGLDPDSVGELPIAELRQRLSDPRVRRRLDGDAQLSRYVPTLLAMVKAKPTISELSLAWA